MRDDRGKYDIELYNGFFRLRNKSYDYKVLYPSVKRVFMLPKNDEINVQLVVRGNSWRESSGLILQTFRPHRSI